MGDNMDVDEVRLRLLSLLVPLRLHHLPQARHARQACR